MNSLGIFLICIVYSLIASVFAASLEEKDNTLGRALIWPLILLLALVKAVGSMCLETKAEMKNCIKTVTKK